MRTYRTSTGPFSEGVYYTDDEIERICSDALRESGFMPGRPEKVRIERFIEKRFQVSVIYEPLATGVLGFTAFGVNGVASVHVAEASDQSLASERRIHSTLAHEAGHALIHTHLFCLEFDHSGLFANDPDVSKEKVLCRDGDSSRRGAGYDGRWWELQANKAIGALLMPHDLLVAFMDTYVDRRGGVQVPVLPESRREEAVRAASETFDVNPAVARIRIEKFFKNENENQLTL